VGSLGSGLAHCLVATAGIGLLLTWTAGAAQAQATAQAQAASSVYIVAKYPVEATAADAVAAKERALADGRQAALRSLLKRLVPVTAYGRLANAKAAKATDLIDGVVVRSERNSATQYIASLDFSFSSQAVRELLHREGLPYVDTQSPALIVVPVYLAPPPGQGPVPAELSPPRGAKTWTEVWSGLDLEHALTPIRLGQAKAELTPGLVTALKEGEGAALGRLARAYATDFVMLAVAEPDLAGKRLNVTLTGRDAVGAFLLKRSYRLGPDDVAYTAELAAVVALGTLEGRWKALKLRGRAGGGDTLSAGPMPVQLMVEFRTLQQWQDTYRQLAQLPGLEGLEIGGLSARNADIAARYPGGAEALAEALAGRGLEVRKVGGVLQVRPAL
jgi:hypothetical protein